MIEITLPENTTKNTLIRICCLCGITLNKENTGDLQWLQPCCNNCTIRQPTYEKYKKLVEFVKKVKDSNEYENTHDEEARDLLKEIGEDE